MDREGDKNLGIDGYSDSDGIHETSFVTASEGGGSDQSQDAQMSEDQIKSSRSMPLPEHLRTRFKAGSMEAIERDSQANIEDLPPPSYSEAVSQPNSNNSQETPSGTEGREDSLTPEEIAVIMRSREDMNQAGLTENNTAADTADDFSPEQQAMYQQRQKDRRDYLPAANRRNSFDEAMEMLPPTAQESSPTDQPDSAQEVDQRFVASMEIEEGRRHSRSRDEFTCDGWGPLDEPVTRFCRFLRRQSRQRLILFSLLVIAGIGLLLFVGLFPASFVYVNYHEIALKQSKLTNVVDRDTVYYPGCYVLGPDTKLLFFTRSVHNIIDQMSVFTLDTIAVTIRYSVHYFIRPPEVGKLFTLFHFDYDDVFQKIIQSSMRNLAGSTLTVDNFRFNRTYVETQMHTMLRKRLGGNCCPECCKEKMCQSNTYCSMCKSGGCNQGYHVDVRFFRLLSVSIPNAVFERLLYRAILEVQKEKEFFLQDHAVMVKNTKQLTDFIRNEATEIVQAGQFEANKITTIAEADKEKVVQTSYAKALQGLYSMLNVTQEDHKLSLLMIHALEESADNLYKGYGFEKNTLFAP